ncbi:hypothetical protein BDV96DRAFT_589506 [Lophiotrema nucula]|uniref:Transmembrane protein n=1 Tax=Lophiotrema nucula TaxID=690887 RepID=A0A6A5YM45_9PLEO|nr:hypothetical protein BDV96DRAFT_589506 [Lophiotrema nucula]
METATEVAHGLLSTALCLCASLLSTQFDILSEHGQASRASTMTAVGGGGESNTGGGWLHSKDNSGIDRSGRTLWALQSRITTSLSPYTDAMQVTRYLSNPSPLAVLVGWLIVACMVLRLRESRSNHRWSDVLFTSSVLLAGILGYAEGAVLSSIILANVPWCLTFGNVVESCLRIAQTRATYDDLQITEEKNTRL